MNPTVQLQFSLRTAPTWRDGWCMQSLIRTATATAAITTALALVAPAAAYADPDCEGLSDNLKRLCEIGNSPAPTGTGRSGGGLSGIDSPEWMRSLPELGWAFWIGLALIIIGAIVYGVTKPAQPAGRAAHGPAAGAARAEAHSEKAIAAFMVGAGIIAVGWSIAGIGGALLSAVIGVPIMLIGIKGDERAEQAKSGYQQADAAWQHSVEMARLNAQLHQPNRAEFDPLGLGIAPPPAPAPVIPSEPRMSDEDAVRYHRMGGHIELIPGSAAAALVARDGSWHAAEAAWIEACKAARLGGAEQRTSRIPGVNAVSEAFVPAADLARVEVLETGDAAVVVRPHSLAIGATELAAVTPLLLRTARVRHAGAWVRVHTTDEYVITLSNHDPTAAQEQTSAPAPTTDDEDW